MVNLVLGAGLAGLSASYHLGHGQCLLLEKSDGPYGHVRSDAIHGYTWDEGPHVSFTKNDYVRELFAQSVNGAYDEFDVTTGNYYKGHWIGHPAQVNLREVPEPLRGECLRSFLDTRNNTAADAAPAHYGAWLDLAFGPRFARTFPAAYTRKYWTVEPEELATDWIGKRIYLPRVEDVVEGSKAPLPRATNYITTVRYPRRGGYQSFARKLYEGANVAFGHAAAKIDLAEKTVICGNGKKFAYDRLISTIPLPVFVRMCAQATPDIRAAADALACSRLLLISYEVPHPARRPEHWIYVYDEDMATTRLHFTEKLAAANAPPGHSGIQVEVYSSPRKPLAGTPDGIAARVLGELVTMGLIDKNVPPSTVRYHAKSIGWANVIFDHKARPATAIILDWLERYGLRRRAGDDGPLTDWPTFVPAKPGDVALAGRFGAWKYYWSDDCVLSGRALGGV